MTPFASRLRLAVENDTNLSSGVTWPVYAALESSPLALYRGLIHGVALNFYQSYVEC